jgi:hypothetical protein
VDRLLLPKNIRLFCCIYASSAPFRLSALSFCKEVMSNFIQTVIGG